MDETTRQCTREARAPIRASRGQTERYDGECQRNGVAHLMLFYSPLENQRTMRITGNHAAGEWAEGVRQLVQEWYIAASKIILVIAYLSTHSGASLYKTFEPELAQALLQKLEFVFIPKHGSWLNMVEREFSVMARQCLDRRIADVPTLTEEIAAWQNTRDWNSKPADCCFTIDDTRIKLRSPCPKVSDG